MPTSRPRSPPTASSTEHDAELELDRGGRHGWFIEHPDHFEQALSAFLAGVRRR
jgi:hypothetical protein